ncbi:PD-(D/E)XK nuclease family protein [Feifania hominis]|uniref:PD-(D/E)XK nuclease family protein n=1 Tax=Feifania hominis TaxID=2763660 RepID=A0A926DE12_9FIRM|nr:PD-(D/E)XK nuclease family protein [Feifania hominis]MBC8535305.1 PD-(D/E)XK nuclease family protein [Feifania hominis]
MLTLITGRAGSGKSRELNRRVRAHCEAGDRVIVLVPEQYTVRKERELLLELGNRLCASAEILNFSRLCDFVFRETGGVTADYIDAGGKSIVMQRALTELRGGLRYYGRAALRPEFIRKLLLTVSEFKTYRIAPADLRGSAGAVAQPELADKLTDLAAIYETYNALLHEHYSDMEDDFERAGSKLVKERVFEPYDIFCDAFTGFSPAEMSLLGPLMRQAKSVTVTLCTDAFDPDADEIDDSGVFAPLQRTACSLFALARANGVPVARPVHLNGKNAFPPEIAHLEASLFESAGKPRDIPCGALTALCAADIYEETDYVARTIVRLVRTEGYRYSDFLVLSRSMESYQNVIEVVFHRYGIPYFLDTRTDTLTKPLVMLLFSAFEAVLSGYRYESVFAYLKTGLVGVAAEEIDVLENYVYTQKISGSKWTVPWTANPFGFNREPDERSQELLWRINKTRAAVIGPLETFRAALRECGARAISTAVYELLLALGVPGMIEQKVAELTETGRPGLAAEYEQIWNILMHALDQMVLLLDDEITAKTYCEVLKLVLAQADIGKIPTSLDEVAVASAERTRTHGVRCCFVVGFGEGDFPRSDFEEGLLNDRDRLELQQHDILLSPTTERLAFEELFYVYCALTSAGERLYISYPKSGASGREKRPSYLLTQILALLPRLEMLYLDERELTDPAARLERIEGRQPSFDYLLTLPPDDPLKTALERYFDGLADYAARRREIDGAIRFAKGRLALDGADTPRLLYGERPMLSATSLERFQLCNFAYFCEYGLRIEPRRQVEFDAMQTGTFMHYILEQFGRRYRPDEIRRFDAAAVRRVTDELVREYIAVYLPDFDERGARFRYLFSRLSRILYAFLEDMTADLRRSHFEPLAFELPIGEGQPIRPLILSDEQSSVAIRGYVDRVDGYERDGKLYIRIVDYKTGRKEFDYAAIHEGMGMQMMLYLFSLCAGGREYFGREIVPAGMLYAPVRLEVVAADHRDVTPDELAKLRRGRVRADGLLTEDTDILLAMDTSGTFETLPVSAMRGEQQEIELNPRRSKVASGARFAQLERFAEKKLLSIARQLKRGSIDINPYKDAPGRGLDSCAFCEMRPVCRFSPERGAHVRSLARMSAQEFWDSVEKEGGS